MVIHELGHFVTAKLFGVKVLEFGIGYPPRLFGITRGETEYTVNVLPLGGFVRLLGEEDPSDPRSLAAQPAPERLIVMGAGSFMNFVLAVTLFTVALMIPREVSVGQAMIAQVVPGSPADTAGLKTGDTILDDRRPQGRKRPGRQLRHPPPPRRDRPRSRSGAPTRSTGQNQRRHRHGEAALGAAGLHLHGAARRRRRQGSARDDVRPRRRCALPPASIRSCRWQGADADRTATARPPSYTIAGRRDCRPDCDARCA